MAGLAAAMGPPRNVGRRLGYNQSPWQTFGGLLRNPDNIPASTYERMFDTDETIQSGVEFMQRSVIGAFGEYQNPDSKRARTFVAEMWERSRISLNGLLEEITSAFWAGHSCTEQVLAYDGGRIYLDTAVGLRPATLEYEIDPEPSSPTFGEVVAARQYRAAGSIAPGPLTPRIPIEKCIHYAHATRHGNPYGRSRLKACWPTWFVKTTLLQAWGMTLERYGSPIGIAEVEDLTRTVIDPVDGTTRLESDVIHDILSNLKNDSSLVVSKNAAVKLLEARRNFGPDFESQQNHANKMLLRSLLIPALLFEPSDIGSFALGSKHFEIFMRCVRKIAAELRRVILRQVIGPLLRWNFGPSIPIGEFVAMDLEEEDLQLWAQIFFSLTQGGYLSPKVQDHLDYVHAKMGLPKMKAEDVPAPEPVAGKDGLPSAAPDGQPSSGQPNSAPKVPSRPQGRPVGAGSNGNGRAH